MNMASEPLVGGNTAGPLEEFYDSGVYTQLFGGKDTAVTTAYGMVAGQGVYTVCQNGSAMRAADTRLCVKTLDTAAKTGNPVVTFYNSPGVIVEEGLSALSAAKDLAEATARISGVVPQIAVVCGTCGASSALAAISADLLVMVQGSELYLVPPFTSVAAGDKVDDAGSADAAVEAGVAALVVEDLSLAVQGVARLVTLLPQNNISSSPSFEYEPPIGAPDMSCYSAHSITAALVDEASMLELFAGFGTGSMTSLATLAGGVVGVVATNGPDSYITRSDTAKIARFVRLCDAFSVPVVTVVNTGGFEPSSSAEVAGALREAGRLAATYADATTARVALVAGRGVGPVFTALSNADLLIAMKGGVIAPLEPTAAVSILEHKEIEESGKNLDAETKRRAAVYEEEVAGAEAARKAGVADLVAEAGSLRATVASALEILMTKRTHRLPKKHGNMPL